MYTAVITERASPWKTNPHHIVCINDVMGIYFSGTNKFVINAVCIHIRKVFRSAMYVPNYIQTANNMMNKLYNCPKDRRDVSSLRIYHNATRYIVAWSIS